MASLVALASCASPRIPVGWTEYSTQLAEFRIEYALPRGGTALQAPPSERKLALTKHEKVALFASLGFGPADASTTRLSLGFGRIPGGPLPEAPSIERLGELVLAEARATHRTIHYESALERVGKQTWFRLENHIPDSEGVQPEAVVYYQPLDGGHYLFVWGFWDASARASQQSVDDNQRVLEQVVESCRITR